MRLKDGELDSNLLFDEHLTKSAQIGLELANFLPMVSKLANTSDPIQQILHS